MDSETKDEVWQLFQKGSSLSYPLTTSGLIFIGCEECDIILQSPGVEKRHAVISYDTLKQEFWIKDLNSVTGTYINGVRIPEQSYFKLSHDDSIRFGYGPIFLLKKTTTSDTDTSKTEDEELTYLADSLEDIRESDLATISAPTEHSSGSSMTSCASPIEAQSVFTSVPNLKDKSPPTTSSSSPVNNGKLIEPQRPVPKEAVVIPYQAVCSETLGSPQHDQVDSIHNVNSNGAIPTAPAMAFTIPFDSDSSSSSRTFVRRKPPARVKENSTTAVVAPSKNKPHSNRHQSMNGSQLIEPVIQTAESLSESASYLIQRMLVDNKAEMPNDYRTWVKPKKSSSTSSPHSSSSPLHSPEKLSPERNVGKENEDNEDNKSESGTYTVETEQHDPQVTEARKKIDEVFGVQKKTGIPKPLELENVTSSDPKRERLKERTTFVPIAETKLYSPTTRNSGFSLFQGKAAQDSNKHAPSQLDAVFKVPPQRPPRSLSRTNTVTKIESPPLTSQSSFTLSTAVAPTIRRAGSVGSSRDAWSDGSSPPQSRNLSITFHGGGHRSNSLGGDKENFGCFWRRKSWNLSCSDLDADQNKSETGSVISDISTSTEPSSHSSHSYGRHQRAAVGSQDAPQMRLNRAFALRRARLGFESDDTMTSSAPPQQLRPTLSKESNLPRTVAPKSAVGSMNSNMSRQDGGRFSLRLPRNAASRIGRTANITNENSNKGITGNQMSHSTGWTTSHQRGIVYPSRRDPAPSTEKDKDKSLLLSEAAQNKSKREVSALDGLVITAVNQLAIKLKNSSCDLLSRERLHYPDRSEARLMIDEVLPVVSNKKEIRQPSSANNNEGSLTRDLSAILKNLKKVEQTLEVLTTLSEHNSSSRIKDERASQRESEIPSRQRDPRSFFIVDV